MKKILLALALFISWNASAAPYYRFWQGNKLSTLTHEQFREGLNAKFITETVYQGEGLGLLSYQPVLLFSNHSPLLADEIALVAYESEEKYRAIRATPRGKAYGELHWKYFNRENSRSTVPSLYAGTVEANAAYDLLGSDADWAQGFSQIVILQASSQNLSPEERLNGLRAHYNRAQKQTVSMGLKSWVVLVTEHALIEYRLWDSENDAKHFASTLVPELHTVTFSTETVKGKTVLKSGEGTNLDAQEITKEKVASVIDHTYLKNEDQGVSLEEQKAQVTKLVKEAIQYGAYAVCVRESMVSFAKDLIQKAKSPLKIVSVIGFPDGDRYSTAEKIQLLEQARRDGADEFDMVIRVKDLKSGNDEAVYQDILALAQASGNDVLKIIFENAYLTEAEKLRAYQIALRALTDSVSGNPAKIENRFFKTSTGFAQPAKGTPVGATVTDVELMHHVGKNFVGYKPAGGVNNLRDAMEYFRASGSPFQRDRSLDPMKFRIGSSSLLKNLFGSSSSGGY